MMEINCCQFRLILVVPVPVVLYRWHQFCLAADLFNRKYWLLYDDANKEGALVVEGPEKLQVAGGGRLVVAQDLDTLEGNFDVRQSLHGDVAHLLLFPHALSSVSLKPYIRCQQPDTSLEPIIYFDKNMTLFTVRGYVDVSEAPLSALCQENSRTLVMITERLNFQSSFEICSNIKGFMAVPNSNKTNIEIYDEFIRFNDHCVDDYGTLYWLGVKGYLESGDWLTMANNQTLSWNNFYKGFDKAKLGQLCASVGGASYLYTWYSTPCQSLMCPLCNFTSTPTFKVRGLCRNSVIDKTLFLMGYKNNKPEFRGPYYTTISWDTDSMTWKLTSRGHKNLSSYMVPKTQGEYPVGVHKWTITGDKCISNEMEVLITICGDDEFTCNDGTCIKKVKHCNLATDCPDRSDELNCRIAQIPSGYSVEMPPPKEKNTPVPILIFLEITSIRRLDILNFKMALDIILTLFWRDARLTMKNLRNDLNSNKIQGNKDVWMPTLQVEDGARSLADLTLRLELLTVQREGLPLPDDDTRLYEDDVYLGSENTLVLRLMYTVDFTCQFQLQRYPFDSQVCSVTFSLAGLSPAFAVLLKHEEGVSFTGLNKLLEYKVTSFNMTQLQNPQISSQRVFLELENLVGYYISSTYIPTLLLLVICYLTLFFDLADFSDRVMISLTSLLVLAALFSQTSQAIPKTAYLKLIDLWFVFLIVVEFLIVLILVIVENLRLRQDKVYPGNLTFISVAASSGNKILNAPESKASNEVNNSAVLMNTLARIILPVLVVAFIAGYFIVCFFP